MHRSLLVAILSLAVPAAASDFTGWKRPTMPANCPLHLARIYQTAGGQPIHLVVSNSGPAGLTLSLVGFIQTAGFGVGTPSEIRVGPHAATDAILIPDPHGATPRDSLKITVNSCSKTPAP